MDIIRVACANHYVACSVGYSYIGVFRYTPRVLASGEMSYGPGRLVAGPFRSKAKAERIGQQYADDNECYFDDTYGSLYGCRKAVLV